MLQHEAPVAKTSGDEITVCKSPYEAANEILRNSFCILKVNASTSALIRRARCHALKILDVPLPSLASCRRILHGNLHGYHVPSPAKRLFRAFPASELQPWPSESFRVVSTELAATLHETLLAVLDKIAQQASPNAPQQNAQEIVPDRENDHQRSRKRARLSESTKGTASDDKPVCSARASPIDIAKCPLDYFSTTIMTI